MTTVRKLVSPSAGILNDRGFEPLWLMISKFGGWPLMNDTSYDETSWNLEDTLSKVFTETGQNYLFQNYISVDPHNSDMYIYAVSKDRDRVRLLT